MKIRKRPQLQHSVMTGKSEQEVLVLRNLVLFVESLNKELRLVL